MKLFERLCHIHKETKKLEKDLIVQFGNGQKVEICAKSYNNHPTLEFYNKRSYSSGLTLTFDEWVDLSKKMAKIFDMEYKQPGWDNG